MYNVAFVAPEGQACGSQTLESENPSTHNSLILHVE